MSTQAEDEVMAQAASDRQAAAAAIDAVGPAPVANDAVASRTRGFDIARLSKDFAGQGAFLYMEDFLAPEVTAQLRHSARGLLDEVNRKIPLGRHATPEEIAAHASSYTGRYLKAALEAAARPAAPRSAQRKRA